MDWHLSEFVSAYRKQYSSQHVLIRLLEEWQQNLDQNLIVGAVLMDISEAFDCISHDLLIAKLSTHILIFKRSTDLHIFLFKRKETDG